MVWIYETSLMWNVFFLLNLNIFRLPPWCDQIRPIYISDASTAVTTVQFRLPYGHMFSDTNTKQIAEQTNYI